MDPTLLKDGCWVISWRVDDFISMLATCHFFTIPSGALQLVHVLNPQLYSLYKWTGDSKLDFMAIFNYGYIFYINFELKVNILIKISVKSSQYQRTCHTTGQENYAKLKKTSFILHVKFCNIKGSKLINF